MLLPLSRHVLPVSASNGLGELLAEPVELSFRIAQLAIDECRLTQFAQYLGRVETANTVLLQHTSNSRFRCTGGLFGCRCGFPKVEHPILIQIAELQHLRVVAPELIP